ncbi:response regulator [Desulfosediminicola sp.]|uniref:response regulator n=1 Tax=Desulfosediminicola sp. TaxID=2886825 RepID=UPI003AF25264
MDKELKDKYQKLLVENQILLQELLVARKAADITADLVAEQFANLDVVVKDLDTRARNEKNLREEMSLARREAEAANVAKSDFLANMSHEIRTPMNGIIGMTDLVLGTLLDENQRQSLNLVKRSANRLLQVINDILDFSKIESGKMRLDPVDFDLKDLLDNCMAMFALSAKEKGISLKCKQSPDLPRYIRTDSIRLMQILINLISNGVKFTDRGTVTLEVSCLNHKADNEAYIKFSVIDTGIGIEPHKQNLIFESFSQADSSMTRKYGGTGLGLAISSKLSELMGSRIYLESTPGEGSIFWFVSIVELVPEKNNEIASATSLISPPDNAVRLPPGIRVLLAEDEPINQTLAVALLTKMGTSVTAVSDGLAVLREISANSYDLVLMDLQMPKLNGFDTTRAIRELDGPAAITPIVALTAHARAEDRQKCLQAGMDDYLSKPIDFAQLETTLYRQLSHRKVMLLETD